MNVLECLRIRKTCENVNRFLANSFEKLIMRENTLDNATIATTDQDSRKSKIRPWKGGLFSFSSCNW